MKNRIAMFAALLVASHLGASPAPADPPVPAKPSYTPAGSPANPKVAVAWDRYHDYAQTTELLQSIAKAHPELCKLQSLGKSFAGREMWLLTITAPPTAKAPGPAKAADRKPALWIDAGIHGNEIQGTEVALYTAWYLTEMFGQNAVVTDLMTQRTFYLVPMMSPDSRDVHMHEPQTTNTPRSGQVPVGDPRRADEDEAADLDGDGSITQMRFADPNGKWKPHPDHPQLLVHVKEGGKGTYTLLGAEGFDRDGDGRVSPENLDKGYDPNRDWPWQWQPQYVQRGALRHPLWVPENRMVAEFIMAHPNIGGALTYHNIAGMIIRAPGAATDSNMHERDIVVFDKLGKVGETILPGYKYLELRSGLYPGHGVEMDWLYAMRGAAAFTIELNTPFNLFRRASEGIMGSEEDLHAFNKYLLMEDAWQPWHEVNHPQFGKTEVGGFKKTWVRQPAGFLLQEECHRNMAFALHVAGQLPQVRVQSVAVKPLPGGIWEITAILQNTGAMPTHLAADIQHHITAPDRARITGGESFKVITGLISTRDAFFHNPTEQKLRPDDLHLENIPGQSVAYVRWLATGAGPFTVTLTSPHGGSDSKTTPARPNP